MARSITECLRYGARELLEHNIESASLDARILLEFTLGFSTEKLLLDSQQIITDKQMANYEALLKRRIEHEPIAYLVGQKEFYGLNFKVNPHVLIPRPDSEILVETALEYVKAGKVKNILELGVGSGCLLLSILYNSPLDVCATTTDISKQALEIAKDNYKTLNIKNKVEFLNQNWADDIKQKYDLIISNPPYIEEDAVKSLALDVRQFEPHLALTGGKNGLDCYEYIAKQLPYLLTPNGVVLLEIGMGQEKAIGEILNMHHLRIISHKQDLAGITRCIAASLSY